MDFFLIIELNGLHMIYIVVYGASTGSYMIIIRVKTLFMVTKTYPHKVVLRCVCEYSNAKSGNINSHCHRKRNAYNPLLHPTIIKDILFLHSYRFKVKLYINFFLSCNQ